MRIDDFLSLIEGEIRWKRAWKQVRRELESHLLEQKDAFISDGMTDAEAETMAVQDMGNAEETGRELNRLHRPKSQWPLILSIVISAVAGAWMKLLWSEADPARVLFYTALGIAALMLAYFLDYRLLLRYSLAFSAAVLLAGAATLTVPAIRDAMPLYYGTRYSARYFSLIFPAAFVLGLVGLRRKGSLGFFTALAAAMIFALTLVYHARLAGMALFVITASAAMYLAVRNGWFGEKKWIYTVSILLFAALSAVPPAISVFTGHRLDAALHPENCADSLGYQAMRVREALGMSALWGGAASEAPRVPGGSADLILTRLAVKTGFIPFMAVIAALTTLSAALVVKAFRQRNPMGRALSLTVALVISLRTAAGIAANTGFILFGAGLPFISGNLILVLDMALTGLALSVFRQENLPETQIRSPGRVKYRDGELIISLR